MKTAQQVLSAIDERIADLEQRAARPCIDALMGDGDREDYREAMRLGAGLKALQELRAEIAPQITNGNGNGRKGKKS